MRFCREARTVPDEHNKELEEENHAIYGRRAGHLEIVNDHLDADVLHDGLAQQRVYVRSVALAYPPAAC